MAGSSWTLAALAGFSIAFSPSVVRAQAPGTPPASSPQPEPGDGAEQVPGGSPSESSPGPTPPRAFDRAQGAPTVTPYPPASGAPGPDGPQYRLPAPALLGPVVTLHADNPRARLQQKELRWETVCTMPCRRPVDPEGLYRVAGGTINPSVTFQMPRRGNVFVEARVGSVVKYWIGFGLAVGGLASAALGGVYLAAADDNRSGTTPSGDIGDPMRLFGWTYLVTGVIMALVGLPLCLSNTTTVELR